MAIRGIFFALPIVVLFWQEHGLSLTQIMVLQSLFAISVVVLEVPSGYLADLFSRKKILIWAGLFSFLGMAIYSISDSFLEFFLAEFSLALAISFISGTDSAFIFDTLKGLGRTKDYKKIFGNTYFITLTFIAISSILGSIIGDYSFRLTFYLVLPFQILLIPIAFSLYEPVRTKLVIKEGYTKELVNILKEIFLHSKKLKWLIIYAGIIFGFNQAVLWFYQPYVKETGVDIIYFGVIFASFQIVAAISSKLTYKLEKKLGARYSLVMLPFLIGISYLLMGNIIWLFSFSFAFIQQFVRAFAKTVLTDYINKLTTSDRRATVLSIHGLINSITYALIIPFAGYFADIYSISQTFIVLGITVLILGVISLFAIKAVKVI
ncbi:MAG: MFS transporter [bacterium]